MKQKLFSLLTLLLCVSSAAWADSKEFVAGTSTGQFSGSTEITDGPVTLKTVSIGGNAGSRQIWQDGETVKNETAAQISQGAGNDPTSKYIEVSVSEGYKITGLTIRGASNGTDNTKVTFKGFCFSGAYSDAVGGIAAVGDLVFPLKTGTSSDAANVSMTGIAENTRTIRVYKNVKYNSSTMQMGNVSGSAATPSADNLNVAKITVSYVATATQYAITWANGGHGTAPTAPTTASIFTLPTMDNADGYKNTGWTADKAVTVGGVEQAAGTVLAVGTSVTLSAATTFTGRWTALATGISVTFAKGDGDGIAPTALADQTEDDEITLPVNRSMFKSGYTMTGWDEDADGVADYAPGETYTIPAADATLTAIYTENTKTLADRTTATTIKWWLGESNGVPAALSLHAGAGDPNTGFVVAQATIAGETIDFQLPIDATTGKFKLTAGNAWAQVNTGTTFSVPAVDGASITYHWAEYLTSTSGTGEATATGSTYDLEVSGDAADAGKYYLEYIQVVIPKIMINPTSGIIFNLNMTYSGSSVNVTHGTETSLGSYGTATSGCDVVVGNNDGSGDDKAQFTSSGIFLNGNAGYVKLDLNFTLQTGDVISFTTANSKEISFTTTKSRSTTEKTASQSYTVGSALNGQSSIYIWRENGGTYVKTLTIMRPATVSVGAKGYATYCNSEAALNFTDKSIKAYVVKSTDGSNLTLTQVNKVAKNTPLLLYSSTNSDSQTIPAIADSEEMDDATGNKLVAGDGNAHTWTEGTAEHYILNTANTPGFYRANNSNVAVGKAYLDLTGVNEARAFSFDLNLGEGETTGISAMHNAQCIRHNEYFDLQGRKVAQPTKGLYIINGKKIAIK